MGGTEARAYGWGGVRAVSGATGMSPNTVRKGWAELEAREENPGAPVDAHVRRKGGGRKQRTEADPDVAGCAGGIGGTADTRRSRVAPALDLQEHESSGGGIDAAGAYRQPPDGGAALERGRLQFAEQSQDEGGRVSPGSQCSVRAYQPDGEAVSAAGPAGDIGGHKEEGAGRVPSRTGGESGSPRVSRKRYRSMTSWIKALGQGDSLRCLRPEQNQGWVSVGIDHDTARFAAEAMRRWWKKMGSKRYRDARELLITADGGGSNGSRCRLWKVALQDLAVRLEMPIHVCHFPPGTSKWNKIEHRMFCHITQNWRGRPLVSHEVIIQLIANTKTQTGLKIRAELDAGRYPTGIKVTDAELAVLNLHRADFHGEWNYTLLPTRKNK